MGEAGNIHRSFQLLKKEVMKNWTVVRQNKRVCANDFFVGHLKLDIIVHRGIRSVAACVFINSA